MIEKCVCGDKRVNALVCHVIHILVMLIIFQFLFFHAVPLKCVMLLPKMDIMNRVISIMTHHE